MTKANVVRIAEMLVEDSSTTHLHNRICSVAIKLLGADGASLAIMVKSFLRSSVATAVEYSFLDEQQITYADGPTFDASKSSEPVSAENFNSVKERRKWPIFAPIANQHGLVSMVAYPMRIAESNLGAISGYRKNADPLSNQQFLDGLALSTLSVSLLVEELAGKKVADRNEILAPVSMDQSLVHFAAGKVAERYNISTLEGLVRMRAYAYKSDLPLVAVATQISDGNVEDFLGEES